MNKFTVLNLGSKTKKQKYCGRYVASLFLFKSFWKAIRSLRDVIFIPSHAVSLDPCIRRTLPLKKQVERRQNWPSANTLLSSSYLSGDLVKSYCQYQKSNWATFSFVSRDRFNFQKGSYFWEQKFISLFFLLIVPFNPDWVLYLFIAYLSLKISARHPRYVLIAFEQRGP